MVLFLELYWCLPAEVTVSATGVVEHFDVFKHRVAKFDTTVAPVSEFITVEDK